ncbi:MAG: DUF4439 domain-containing protein [Propionibacteriales bacterium]|nr:DUF4439 domain-containing protein [Propionibacteriales bacterium]
MAGPSPVGPLQRRLALEHEAVWLTSLSAGRFGDLADAARAALGRHERARDALVARVAAAGATPVGPQAAYGVPPRSVDQARGRLADLAERMCRATVPLVALGSAEDRREAVQSLRASALEATSWGAAPSAFPGLDRS